MTRLAAAWQDALAVEQRAVFGYDLLGAHLRATPHLQLAISCSGAHEALRDHTSTIITASGQLPEAPQPDYPALYPVRDADAAMALALRLEQGCAEAWRGLYAAAAANTGSAASSARRAAQTGLGASAVRATRWRRIVRPTRATDAFPGL